VSDRVSRVGFVGPRVLPAALAALVPGLVSAVASAFPSASVLVGCCAGADALVLSCALASGLASRLSVFAAFSSSGAGSAGRLSAVPLVRRAAGAGAWVCWLAGGPLSVPLRARLLRRSLALVDWLSSAAWPSFVLAFLVPASRGSLAAASAAAAAGVPVLGVVASPGPPPALSGVAGSWAPCPRLAGLLPSASAWRWVPAQRWFEGWAADVFAW
jgi:hypothetical protein